MSPLRALGRGVGGLALAGLGCVAYGTFVETRRFRLREAVVECLPPGAPALTVLHVGDLHHVPGQRRKSEFVRSLAALEPDLVVNTGDNLSSPRALEEVLETFAPLLCFPGVFVWGSNDFFAPHFRNPFTYLVHGSSRGADDASPHADETPDLPWEALRDAFTAAGWRDLNHASAELTLRGLRVALRGTEDEHIDRARPELVAGPYPADADVRIALTHAPYRRVLDALAADGADVILAGHTHGGQVCLPGGRAIVTNCDIEPARVKGLSAHTAGDATSALHVTGGLGVARFAPYRFWCLPEATVLRLVARP